MHDVGARVPTHRILLPDIARTLFLKRREPRFHAPGTASTGKTVAVRHACGHDMPVLTMLQSSALEHGVAVCRLFRNPLQHIPVLYDLSVQVEPARCGCRPNRRRLATAASSAGPRSLPRENPPELDMLAGVLSRHAFEVLDERFLTVRYTGIVPSIRLADVSPNGLGGLRPVERQIVKGSHS